MNGHWGINPTGVQTAIDASATASAACALKNAYVVSPFLTPEQASLLVDMFSPIQLSFQPEFAWSHPMQRVIHNYLEKYVRSRAGRCLEVGAHPRSVNENPNVLHRCYLRPEGRDIQRWFSAPRRGPVCHQRIAALRGRQPDSREYCFDGFTDCRFSCQSGIALYSLHDLTPRAVYRAMQEHNMTQMYAIMHLPPECLLPAGVYTTDTYTLLNTGVHTIVTYAGDTSAGYHHHTPTLVKWLKATRSCGCSGFIIERVRAIGCHFVLLITIANAPHPMPYTPYPKWSTVYVRSVFGTGGTPCLFDIGGNLESAYYAVPVHIWDRLMLFGATLSDDAFCCDRLMTYLRGIAFKVKVGRLVANEGWVASESALTSVIVASYVTICHNRWLRTQGVSKAIKRLEEEHAQGLLLRMRSWLSQRLSGKESFLPGQQLQFYKQCSQWISAGFIFDPRKLLFDKAVMCWSCRPVKNCVKKICCFLKKLKQACFCATSRFVTPLEGIDNPAYEESVAIREPTLYDIAQRLGDLQQVVYTDNYQLPGLPRLDIDMLYSPFGSFPHAYENPLSTYSNLCRGRAFDVPQYAFGQYILSGFSVCAKVFYQQFAPNCNLDNLFNIKVTFDVVWGLDVVEIVVYYANQRRRYTAIHGTCVQYRGVRYSVQVFTNAVEIVAGCDLPSREQLRTVFRYRPAAGVGRGVMYSSNTTYKCQTVIKNYRENPDYNPPFPSILHATEPSLPPSRVVPDFANVQPVLRPSASMISVLTCDTRVTGSVTGTEPVPYLTLADGSKIFVGDIFDSKADWLVNAANPRFNPGGGLCGQFYRFFPGSFTCRPDMELPRARYTSEGRQIIHAVAPDARQKYSYQELADAYEQATYRIGRAAYPLLGAGIYCVPPKESLQAWLENHRPGDELWIQPSLQSWLIQQDISLPTKSVMQVTPKISGLCQLAFDIEDDKFRGFVRGLTVPVGSYPYKYTTGPPGSGKSKGIRREDCDVVICPTKQLRQEWQRRGFVAYTQHKGLKQAVDKRLIIDEAPSLPRHLLLYYLSVARSSHLLGDPLQIPALDFSRREVQPALVDACPLVPTDHLLLTHRCPRDVTAWLRLFYPGIRTSSLVQRSVFFNNQQIGQLIVFTQAAKAANPGAITVHEAQGSTFRNVTVLATADARGLVTMSQNHCIVALTRHTDVCHIVDEAGLFKEIGLPSAFEQLTNISGVLPEPSVPGGATQTYKPDASAAASVPLPNGCQHAASAFLAEALGHRPLEVGAILPPCPQLEQGQLYMSRDLTPKDRMVVVRLSDTVHCRMAAPSDRRAVLSTLVGRYGRMTSTSSQPVENVRRALLKWIPYFEPSSPTTLELAELVQSKLGKSQDGTDVLELDLWDKDCTRITFFQKDCNKFTVDEVVNHGKVGQGISAWSKTCCALFGVWFRAMEKVIVKNLPDNVFYGDVYDLADFDKAVSVASGKVFENDFSEFDSTQNNLSLSLECMLMREFGMPEWMVNLYWILRESWVLQAPQESLAGRWKKHSGEPGTLLFNTVWNMAVLAYCYEFSESAVLAFKGDDSVVVAQSYAYARTGADLISSCGLKLKTNFSDYGTFAGYFVCPGLGVLPDVVRFYGRLSEKNWNNKFSRCEELQDAISDFLRGVVAIAYQCSLIAADYYDLSVMAVLTIIATLRDFTLSKPYLVEYVYPILDTTQGFIK
uniref:ORF1 protein n=1 Tax=Spalax hepevirus TaxID=2796360 RepID=A0A8E0NAI0_9VIRU|nr:TPA: ORF1 protein [Spalax hepevirus]